MNKHFTSGLLAGVTAAVIWIAAAMLAGVGSSTIGLWALVLLVVTTVVATIIAAVVGRNVPAGSAR